MKILRKQFWLIVCWVALGTFPGMCQAKPVVVTTTTMITDLVRTIGTEHVDLLPLMGPGIDPHQYKASARDSEKIRKATLIFYNGLHLEGKMDSLFKNLAQQGKAAYAVTRGIPQERLMYAQKNVIDPHVWFDIQLWSLCAQEVADVLCKHDAQHTEDYQQRCRKLQNELESLHKWCLAEIATIPEQQRILITSHDAYHYFGNAYGIQVVGVQGISTVTEAGLGDVIRIVDLIKKHSIKAIFVESSVSPATIERISKDSGISVGGELFSDSTGYPGVKEKDADGNTYDVSTYSGMVRHNVNIIVNALK
jgi:manganese/zinc/iron transport system substrate-binding protein